MSPAERFGSHIIFWLISLLVCINAGFILGFPIGVWSLPISYLAYIFGLLLLKQIKKQTISKFDVALVFLLPLYLIIATFYFGKTYDSSFDGQDYHSGGVIELANGWNPWWDKQLPILLPDANSYVTGYPKSLWMIQTSIYEITNKLNTATVTNFIILIVSSIFVYGALLRLRVPKKWSVFLTIFTILELNTIQQFFTYMADGFSYQLMLVAISSFIMLVTDKKKLLPFAVFCCALILLAGIKFSNLFVFSIMGTVGMAYVFSIVLKHKQLIPAIGFFGSLALLLLWVPYGTNFINHETPIYPSNMDYAQNDLDAQNVPNNLKDENKFVLLYHGIYSEMQKAGTPDSPENIARIKIPFSTRLEEITITNNYNGRVGSEGVFFSGIFTVSLVLFFVMLFTFPYIFYHKKHFLFLSLIIGLIIISTLLNPTPNVLRIGPLIYLIPVCVMVALIRSKLFKEVSFVRQLSVFVGVLIACNIMLKLAPTVHARIQEFNGQDYLIATMKKSNKQYEVRTQAFYSNYIVLKEHGLNFKIVDKLSCPDPKSMWVMFTTYYCEKT